MSNPIDRIRSALDVIQLSRRSRHADVLLDRLEVLAQCNALRAVADECDRRAVEEAEEEDANDRDAAAGWVAAAVLTELAEDLRRQADARRGH